MTPPSPPRHPATVPRATPPKAVVALLWGLRVLVIVLTVIVTWSFVAELGHPLVLP
ncbi:hypothetical protein GHK86_03400 [Acidimicrobiaceae bacterium USS-CC1]|uniref:ABC transporter permease n=1 Tax=Acidiferrimicrobium australe TaxID=2664430 RepID=A0ABW9QPX2_9ACTN|nr:hypothetical protein [Acidiferrimicrobium australe]